MVDGTESGIGVVELVYEAGIFVPAAFEVIDLVVEFGVVDTDMTWADTNDGTKYMVQVADLEQELTPFYGVRLVVCGERC